VTETESDISDNEEVDFDFQEEDAKRKLQQSNFINKLFQSPGVSKNEQQKSNTSLGD